MKKCIIAGLAVLGMLSLTSFTNNIIKEEQKSVYGLSDEITAIINKDTSEKELEDLKDFFEEEGIELVIKKIKYNASNELTNLSLVLKKGSSKSQYSSSSNTPIDEIELGYKNGGLFIDNAKASRITVNGNSWNFNRSHIQMDSIMKKHGISLNFNDDSDSLLFNGHINFQKLKDQIVNSFSLEFDEDEDGNFIFNGQLIQPFKSNTHSNNRFSFIDNPDIDKLIIIDGKESDFETLDRLAKTDKLTEVDFLKSQTAISIYGNKAKDGAIIATTKK